MVALIHV